MPHLRAALLPWVALVVTALPCASQTVEGVVLNDLGGFPVVGAEVSTTGEGGASVLTDTDGHFLLTVRGPSATLIVTSPGYQVWREEVRPGAAPLEIRLHPDPFLLEGIRVRSRAFGTTPSLQPTTVLGQRELAERMSASIAASLVREPGVTVRTNGPMATQPVVRGLSGNRVLVLEDGVRVGDISTTAPDHAVTIEPATVRTVEVIRGPAGLLYGSNTLGGVINVRREDIPHELLPRVDWGLSASGESVNRGGSIAARARGSTGPLAFHVDGAVRSTGDTRTPRGVPLPFTDIEAVDAGGGVSFIQDRGHVGAAVRAYRSTYGVPSSYQGVTLPGSHDGGVYIEAERISGRVDGEWRPAAAPRILEAVAFGANAVRFEQWEYEQGGFIGTRFGQLAASGDAVVRLRGDGHRGAVGAAMQWKDLRAEGSFTGTRPAREGTLSLFAVEEFQTERADLLAGVRLDRVDIVPLDSTETLLVQGVRTRQFRSVTAAVGLRAPLPRGWSATLQLARAFRPPSIEELFSAGPHLASYAYEIGNPNLSAERGSGVDLLLARRFSRGSLEVTGFFMKVDGFIGFEPLVDEATGLPLRDPRLRRYVVYAPVQRDARLGGIEVSARLRPIQGWELELAADLLHGQASDGSALPAIPPASGRLEVRHVRAAMEFAIDLEARGRQTRTPEPPPGADVGCEPKVEDGEASVLPSHFCPTDGILLVGLIAAFELGDSRFPWSSRITVGAQNILDSRWHDPLWRAKQVSPQPGRNLRIGLQITP